MFEEEKSMMVDMIEKIKSMVNDGKCLDDSSITAMTDNYIKLRKAILTKRDVKSLFNGIIEDKLHELELDNKFPESEVVDLSYKLNDALYIYD